MADRPGKATLAALMSQAVRGGFVGAEASLITSVADLVASLEDENARLREALKPFARRAKAYDPEEETENEMTDWFGGGEHVTVGDLRRARAALGGGAS